MDPKQQLVCLSGIRNAALAAGELPRDLKLLNWGDNPSAIGPVRVGEESLTALSAQIAGKTFARILIDFEHSSEKGHPNYQPPPRMHAGYGDVTIARGQGVALAACEWTPSGQKFAREYCDMSPTIKFVGNREVGFIKSVALCPNGLVDELRFFAADGTDGATTTNAEEVRIMDKVLILLRRGLGLTDADGEEKIVEGLKALCAVLPKVGSVESTIATLSAALADGGRLTTLAADFGTVKTDLAGLKAAEVKALAASVGKLQRDFVCYGARLEGKVIPLSADEIGKLELPALESMVAKLPAGQVPLVALSAGSVSEPAGGALSDQDKATALSMGFTLDQVAKANKLKA